MEWNEQSIAQLRALWADGLSTAEIGRRMGITKNAVVGKAHRLQLSSRPSPIRRERRAEPVRLRRPVSTDLRMTVRTVGVEQGVELREPTAALLGGSRTLEPRSSEAGHSEQPRAIRTVASLTGGGRVSPCCWPIGEPGTRSFRFCDANTLAGKPYCAEHAQLAYVRVRDKRDAVA